MHPSRAASRPPCAVLRVRTLRGVVRRWWPPPRLWLSSSRAKSRPPCRSARSGEWISGGTCARVRACSVWAPRVCQLSGAFLQRGHLSGWLSVADDAGGTAETTALMPMPSLVCVVGRRANRTLEAAVRVSLALLKRQQASPRSPAAAAAAVSHFCACIGSPCLRQCVHGAPIGGGRGGGGVSGGRGAGAAAAHAEPGGVAAAGGCAG
jgi:hypothetical protein